jgi:uncharacterized protein YkwD
MTRRKNSTSFFPSIYPLVAVILLSIGLFATINHLQKNQSFNTSAAAVTNCTVTAAQLTITTQEQTLLSDINQYRTQNNINTLEMDSTLKQAAAWLSNDMATHNTLSHTDSLNRTPGVRLSNCGYDISEGYGESIAGGISDPTQLFNALIGDTSNKAILLNANYNIAGIDMELSSSGTAYWTIDLGSGTATTPTVTITTAPTVALSGTPSLTPENSLTPTSPQVSTTVAPVTNDMLISVSVKLNGIGSDGNPHPMHLTRKVTAYVYGAGTSPVTTGTGYLTYDGSNYFTGVIHLGKLAQGAYFIKLTSDNTLQILAKPEFQNLEIGQVNQIPPVTLLQGDMNGDNVINIEDYNLVLPCFQDKNCSTASTIDFNDDGKTDVTDYNIFLQSFLTQYGD